MVTDIKKINPYYAGYKFRAVPDLDQRLKQDYDFVFDRNINFPFKLYPRLLAELGIRFVLRDIYYCIDLLYQDNPKTIIDVGCGICHWKKYFPNIYGIDTEWIENYTLQDSKDLVDESFAIINKEKFDCGMMINVGRNLTLEDLVKQISLGMKLVNKKFLFTLSYNNMHDVLFSIRKLLDQLPYPIVMFDYTDTNGSASTQIFDDFINGNIKFILEHK